MEQIVERMQNEQTGVPVRTVKSFMSKIPSVFTGADLIAWMMKNLDVDDQTEALHLAHLMASHGYFFPIDDHVLTVKADGTFYRFQTPYFWPSNCWEPENTDYAVYLCKRTMQNKARLELADYEAENLARLQKMFSRKWEFIFMQAEAQAKVDKKRDKLERKVLDSQERAFWDVHRPVPGCVNTTEIDIKKACRMNKPIKSAKVETLKARLDGGNVKITAALETYKSYYEKHAEYDGFCMPLEPSNPWISDSTEFWEMEKQTTTTSSSLNTSPMMLSDLLRDPAGREHFIQFLEKEFWEAVQELKQIHLKDVPVKVQEIWNEYLAPDANCPINIDSRSYEITKVNMQNPDRWTFDEAATSVKGLRSVISFTAKKDPGPSSS
ncbi:hypothetical protein HPB52_001157 [Rhipicephalus sanguineus]|uniref:Regulator of G-protein signaling 7 n=1 Tax=Rhipicephalus sanguineus TaxID=34632 RepID=A0A9D4Q968_RHISA|nr:hypothetical protein HPB52_001157 [Rhipicephalus sanguineus]